MTPAVVVRQAGRFDDGPLRARCGRSEIDRAARGDAAGGTTRFGELGAPFDRRSPFRIGVLGGLGLAVAYVVWLSITAAAADLLLIVLAWNRYRARSGGQAASAAATPTMGSAS